MFQRIVQDLQLQARNLVLGLIGGILVAIGAGFLVTALWMLLAEQFDAKIASLVIGGVILGGGLIVMALRGSGRSSGHRSKSARLDEEQRLAAAAAARQSRPFGPGGPYPALMEAFLLGVTTYLQIRGATRPRR
ncbi:hypothetical protein [Szabonella alba]|uniref:Holin-X, holin superfamily III n=1 Tax=Szabonella alba TaxID=2804194 RepID=A0A8K0VBF7_9RHOB|nr:hypothetical protein [Szabonella alba]MBL4916679.1 hypothetical protein [Szabonella alba]